MCARCRFLCVGMSVFSAVLLCKSTNRGIAPSDFFPSYISTYVDRDVREELGVRKIAEFNVFLELAALRVGEVLNTESLANDCGISVDTAKSWLSILGSSLFVFDHISKITESGLLKRQSFIFTILDLRRICLALNLLNS